jgi:hypothetical protein
MKKRLKTLSDIREFLTDKIERKDGYLSRIREGSDIDILELMRYDAIEISVSVLQADEARKYLEHVGCTQRPNGDAYSDDEKFADICEEVREFFMRRVQSQFSDVGRSSSISANLAKDAVKEFYVEFFQRLNDGY